MSKLANHTAMGIVEPQARIRHLGSFGNTVDVDPNIPIRRYYRSGMEMVRMANVYLSEGNHENAYILYMKFMTLFIEKILTHPEYRSVPSTTKQPIQAKLKDVMPVTEKLKVKLLDRYKKEYAQFLATKEAERAKEIEKNKEGSKEKNAANELRIEINPSKQPTAPDISLLDQVVYPNDFPSGSNRLSELILADTDKNQPRPLFDRSHKPSQSLIEGTLRTVVIPEDTMKIFLNLANKNTNNNIETCGILAGKLERHRLLVTHVIVPKQHGTPDSCTTMNEEDIFDVQDQTNLITLGWIHTHPSQTAFLSSVDLHTHCSYQMMMPEAIAVVCAPKYQSNGFFCLTPNYGLDFIAQCRKEGFHPHPNDPPLFMEAQHIILDERANVEVVDLRSR
uniref:Putative smad6 n=1 Tax=Tabanus bromius TaxID=304241 RepID=A0A0K8TKB2_TABBR